MNKPKNNPKSFKKKSSARRSVMQALYGWMMSNNELSMIEQHYLEERNPDNFDVNYFKLLLHEIPTKKQFLDQAIAKHSNRSIDQLDPIEHSILLVASYELFFSPDIPFKVTIHEALELASMFSNETSYKFINAVVDRLAVDCRKK